ncbi:hypothetical protein, partial [Streptomyces sp. NPDC058434]|uniref:hypothetical protein n=1 Tax=Streptomyces sp. NPDC058434 TaxID=3346498 RepID=UPI00364662AA
MLMVAATVLFPVPTAPHAHAANGEFRYHHAYTRLHVTLRNPSEGTCIQATNLGCVRNLTNRAVTLYPSPACQGEPLGTLEPGQSQALAFGSITF